MKIKKFMAAALSACLMLPAMTGLSTAAGGARVSVHDPSIVKDKSTYYVFGSHIEAAKSSDLQNWKRFSNGYATTNNVEFGNLSQNLKKAFDWAGENLEDCVGGFAVWAPDVVWDAEYINKDGSKGAYLMYFCTSSTYMRSVIAYAASKNIEGPYTFVDTLIYSGFTNNDSYATSNTKNVNRKYTSTNVDELIAQGQVTFNNSWFNKNNFNNQLFPNAIDPTIYYDTDGKMYMCYGSWSGGIFTLEIDPKTGQCIHPKTGQTADGRMVDSYFGTKISGGYGKSGEGPFIEYNADTGYYYLWVTFGGLTSTGGYNMRVFRSTSPLGPFTDPAGRQAVLPTNSNLDSTGLKVMGNYKFSSLSKAYMACGHNSVLKDDDGKWYLVYHTRFDDGAEFHEVRVHSMYFNEQGWPVVAPYEYAGDVISETGYNEEDIVGDYEFINHGSSTDGKIINYSSIKLNADGTISGSVTGKWSQAQDNSAAVITIGNQVYTGYFLAAKDENGKKVMSFTAVGSNNQTIWGVQTKQFSGSERSGLADFTDKNSQLINKADTVSGSGAAVKLSGTELLSGVSYYIINQNSGMAIDLPNGKLDEGTNIQQWERNSSWAQQWRIIAVDKDYCKIVSVGDESMCIAAAQSSADDGVNIELQKYTGKDNQLFKIRKCGSDYGIVSKCSNDTGGLDVYEWSKENGGNVNQFAYNEYACQLWNIAPVYPKVNAGTYTLRNVNSGLYVGMNASGSLIQFAEPVAWDIDENSRFSLPIDDAIPVQPTYIAVDNGSNGEDIAYKGVNNADSANMKLICNKDGSYSVMTGASEYKSCWDVFEKSTEAGANIGQWEFNGGDWQKFVIEPAVRTEIPEEIITATTTTTTTTTTTEATTTPEPTTTTETATTTAQPEEQGLAGDTNCDGKVDISDDVLIMQSLSNPAKYGTSGSDSTHITEKGKANGDVTGGGDGLTNMDALEIQKFMLGLVDKLTS